MGVMAVFDLLESLNMIKVNPRCGVNKLLIEPIRGSCWARGSAITFTTHFRGGESQFWNHGM